MAGALPCSLARRGTKLGLVTLTWEAFGDGVLCTLVHYIVNYKYVKYIGTINTSMSSETPPA